MGSIEKSIEVDVPVTTVYNQWTQFEEFPRFMEGVQEVRQLDDSRLYWKADVGGRDKEWHARIIEQVPDQRIAWQSEQGAQNGGQVTFEPVDGSRTRITLNMQYEPDDFVESAGNVLGFVSRRVQSDLERFKEFIETRGHETGAWRGSIRAG
ncbi:MAG: SRPBCC family protein [Dehalococcoidia bacterium]|nr:SRPBCC family protein [Dehalococcoidia bacterium]